MLTDNYVCIAFSKQKSYTDHETDKWYRPSVAYPELEDKYNLSAKNEVYDTVRNAFHLLHMDDDGYGSESWNPLGDIINPGENILIKPNLVMDYNRSGEGTDCLYTNPQVMAPIIDYVLLALKGSGSVMIGDAPMQECNFDYLLADSGYLDLVEYYRKERKIEIRIVDFRGLITKFLWGGQKEGFACRRFVPE